MSNGPVEIARDAVKGLSASPILLIIAVLNVIMIGAVGYVANQQRDERRELRMKDDVLFQAVISICAPHGKGDGAP